MAGFFDDLEGDSVNYRSIKPLHTVLNNEKDILDWCNEAVEVLKEEATSRTMVQRHHLCAYRGSTISSQKATSRDSERYYRSTKIDKFVVNHLHDMTETKISQLTRLKPNVEIIPTTDDFNDKNAAKAVKLLVNHLWYINDIDDILSRLHRHALIFGETYLFIEWDPNAGDLHPAWVEAQQTGEQLFHLDEQGNPISPIIEPVKIGDISYEQELPWRVLLDMKERMEDVDFCFRIKIKSVEDLKKDYPSKADRINNDRASKAYDTSALDSKNLEDDAIVYVLYHRPTKHLPKGMKVIFTKDVILERLDYPFSHGELPFIRLTDLDIPGQLHGSSRYEMVQPIQNMHNNMSTLLAKNIYLTGHAKWVMPRGACKIEQLANDNTIIQYQGPVPPTMAQVHPNPPEAYAFRESLKAEMGQVYGVHGTSRGAPPPGITAGVALQFLNEQENERATSDITKHNNMVSSIARLSVAVAGDNYKADDGRMLRILGKDNGYMLRFFDTANLQKDYDIRVQNSSYLPETKAARTQRIVETMQYKPNLIPDEQWMELLDFGNSEKMVSIITEAVRASESENEDLLSGQDVADPQEWEDHIIHWRIHTRILQRRAFKEEVPPELRARMIDHIATTEYAMIEKAKVNPLFQAKLAQLDLFPIFYNESGFMPQSAEHQQAMVQGAANAGNPVNNVIPAQEPVSFPGEVIKNNQGGNNGR